MSRESHAFRFDGGDKLNIISASWFVSYSLYLFCDKNHDNWRRIKTWRSRLSVYENTKSYHKFWIEQIVNMDEKRLSTNKIGLGGLHLKQMASVLLQSHFNKSL